MINIKINLYIYVYSWKAHTFLFTIFFGKVFIDSYLIKIRWNFFSWFFFYVFNIRYILIFAIVDTLKFFWRNMCIYVYICILKNKGCFFKLLSSIFDSRRTKRIFNIFFQELLILRILSGKIIMYKINIAILYKNLKIICVLSCIQIEPYILSEKFIWMSKKRKHLCRYHFLSVHTHTCKSQFYRHNMVMISIQSIINRLLGYSWDRRTY